MMYVYVKALHIIFVVTWFAGLFYIVRLFIYNREAQDKPEPERKILQDQFGIMINRLWWGITWPSCILTLIFGTWLLFTYQVIPTWLWIKIGFVLGLLLYHFSLQVIFQQHKKKIFKYSSGQLRIWNEVATVFLVAIVMLVVVRSGIGLVWSLSGLVAFVAILMAAIKVYKYLRNRQ
ncbi:MAG: CopD family protein [Cyclobacteriaceae bacterium]|nr:CopD family protein [Cyclobacteriaceae bacterium]